MSPQLDQRIDALSRKNLNSFNLDPFGFDPESVKPLLSIGHWLFKNYFRCEVFGEENIPKDRAIVISNHSGQLPFDALMIELAFLQANPNPRYLRGMTERWSAELPFIGSLFVKSGAVVGEPNTCEALLNHEEAVLVFPEGVGGISKLYKNKYKLSKFGHGFMKLAIKTNTPIIPVALVGAEEQAPSIANFKSLGKLLGTPGFPLIFPQIIPFPMPVKYRIHIGKPLIFNGDITETGEEDMISNYVSKVKSQVQNMLNRGVKSRKSIFF